jgi:hypothetical protein
VIEPPFKTLSHLPLCSAGLYIEDERSHSEFHSPANRFYEMLSAHIPIFFDVTTLRMLGQAGIYPHENWIAATPEELHRKLTRIDLRVMRAEQHNLWHADYKLGLAEQLKMAWSDHNGL